MNLVKAADDLKNLSDQQLMMAGQNPVVVPPYLVLAEMKRREQLRAEYAKSQQQQQQPTVAQQVVQGMAQGQPQQPQPQAQGIMQAMPQGGAPVQAMAGGGQVGRYADGKAPQISPELAYAMSLLGNQRVAVPTEVAPTLPMTMEDINRMYPSISVKDKIETARQLLGTPDYSQYEGYLQQQMQEAKSKKPSFGDALIAAGAAMAANRDPRVGIANVLAQGIGAGSEAYRAQQERQKKDLQTAMMAQMALGKMKQEDLNKRIELASQLASSERGEGVAKMQMLEHARTAAFNKMVSAKSEAERHNRAVELKKIDLIIEASKQISRDELDMKKIQAQGDISKDVARIAASSRFAERPPTAAQAATDRGNALASDALMQAEDYLSKKGKLEGGNQIDLALRNLNNPNYFAGFKAEDRIRAASALRRYQKELQDQYIASERLKLAKEKGKNGYEYLLKEKDGGAYDDDIKDAIGMGAVPR